MDRTEITAAVVEEADRLLAEGTDFVFVAGISDSSARDGICNVYGALMSLRRTGAENSFGR